MNKQKEILRFQNLTAINHQYERVERLHLIIREGETGVFWGRDYTVNAILDIFHGNISIQKGRMWINSHEVVECSQEELLENRVLSINSRVEFMKTLDIAENLFLLKMNRLRKIMLNQKAIHIQAQEILGQYGVDIDVWDSTENLSVIEKVLISIIEAVDKGAKILILDNISSVYNQEDMKKLLELLKKVKQEKLALLIFDMYPERFFEIADSIYAVNKGQIEKKIYDRKKLYLLDKIIEQRTESLSEVNVKSKRQVSNHQNDKLTISGFLGQFQLNISIMPGEIVYLTSPYGEEQKVFWDILNGKGELDFSRAGIKKRYGSRKELIEDKIGFWGEEDVRQEVLENLSIKDNVMLPSLKKISRYGFYKAGENFLTRDDDFFEGFKLQERRVNKDKEIIKMIYYRWKLFHPRLLIINNVLSRADGEMKEWISKKLINMCERKTSIILLESAQEEAAEISDRMIQIVNKKAEE